MDERERGEIRSIFESKPCQLRIETLNIADYIISQDIAIERKRGDDLVSSIYDTRFFQQLYKLKTAFQFPILILESPNKIFERKFVQENSIYGALVYAVYKMHIPIITTKDADETAKVILKLAIKEQLNGSFPDFPLKIDKFSIKKEITYEDQKFFLEGLIDVGDIKAQRFLDMFGNPLFILHAISQTEIIYTKKGNPKGISGIMTSFKGIGAKLIKRNQNLLNFSYSQALKLKIKIRE